MVKKEPSPAHPHNPAVKEESSRRRSSLTLTPRIKTEGGTSTSRVSSPSPSPSPHQPSHHQLGGHRHHQSHHHQPPSQRHRTDRARAKTVSSPNVSKMANRTGRAGPITRNPFLNYLRDFRRKTVTGLSAPQIAVRAAEEWRNMRDCDKDVYFQQAKRAKKRRKKAGRKRQP